MAAKDKIIVGTIGDLEPGAPDFAKQFERFHRNPLFRGIRYGNLWGRSLDAQIAKPEFVAGLKLVADAGLVMDTANPDPALIRTMVRVTDRVPTLRVVIDHLPAVQSAIGSGGAGGVRSRLARAGGAPAGIREAFAGAAPGERPRAATDLEFYRPRLDELCGIVR